MAEKIGQILIRKEKINPTQLREALRTQQFFGGYLGSHLINLGFIDEASLGETLSEIYRVPFAPFDSIRLARPEVIAKVPATLAQRFRVVPIQIEGNRMHLAMLNPRDAVAINEVSSATGLNVTPWVAPEFRIIQALERHYRLKKTARGPIKIKEQAAAHETVDEDASAPVEPPVPSDYRPVEVGVTGAMGFDGHPLHATVVPELGDSRPAITPPLHTIPRSLQEWREDAADHPAERGVQAADLVEETAPPRVPDAGIEQIAEAMASVRSRDDLAREVLKFMASRLRRAAIFAVRQDVVSGWMACGEGFERDQLAKIKIPALAGPFFSSIGPGRDVYSGPVPDGEDGREFCKLPDGRLPPAVLLVGVTLRNRLVTILYADNEHEPLDAGDAVASQRIARMMGAGLEILILKNRMKQL